MDPDVYIHFLRGPDCFFHILAMTRLSGRLANGFGGTLKRLGFCRNYLPRTFTWKIRDRYV